MNRENGRRPVSFVHPSAAREEDEDVDAVFEKRDLEFEGR